MFGWLKEKFDGAIRKFDEIMMGEEIAAVLYDDAYTLSDEVAERAAKVITVEEPEDPASEEACARFEEEAAAKAEEYFEELVQQGTNRVWARVLAWDYRESLEQDYYIRYCHKGGFLSYLWLNFCLSLG